MTASLRNKMTAFEKTWSLLLKYLKHETMHIIKGVDKLGVWSMNVMFSQSMTV